MPHLLSADAKGVYVIAATPFTDAGAVDYASIDTLVDFYLRCGVNGMTILGVMGEAPKLSEEESLAVMQRFMTRIDGKIPVIVGVSNPGMPALVRLADASMATGAAGVMVQPLTGLKTEDTVLNYIRGVFAALPKTTPVCFQDYPQINGVFVSADTIIKMIDEHANLVMVKHEEAPGLRKLGALRKACDGKARRYISILCGNGGMHLPQEYGRGADGAMTGFAYPDMLVQMDKLFAAGKPDEAENVYDDYLPLLRHEGQMGIGMALRKEILRRRGAMASAATRAPGPKLDAADHAELDKLMARLEKKITG